MSDEIVLDLGEYREIVVEPDPQTKGASLPAVRGGERRRVKIDAGKLLRAPLTGLSRVFLATLPECRPDDPYALDEFSVEFELGLEAEGGSNLGAVATITPNGCFKCTYTWKRRAGGLDRA